MPGSHEREGSEPLERLKSGVDAGFWKRDGTDGQTPIREFLRDYQIIPDPISPGEQNQMQKLLSPLEIMADWYIAWLAWGKFWIDYTRMWIPRESNKPTE